VEPGWVVGRGDDPRGTEARGLVEVLVPGDLVEAARGSRDRIQVAIAIHVHGEHCTDVVDPGGDDDPRAEVAPQILQVDQSEAGSGQQIEIAVLVQVRGHDRLHVLGPVEGDAWCPKFSEPIEILVPGDRIGLRQRDGYVQVEVVVQVGGDQAARPWSVHRDDPRRAERPGAIQVLVPGDHAIQLLRSTGRRDHRPRRCRPRGRRWHRRRRW